MRLELVPLLLAALLLGGESPAHAAACMPLPWPERSTLAEWAVNTALVHSSRSNRPNGLGLVVGWTTTAIWVAVPAHVIFGDPAPGEEDWQEGEPVRVDYAAGLSVTLFGGHESSILCDQALTSAGGEDGDVVFVCLQRAGRLPLFNDYLLGEVEIGDEVRLLGRPSAPGHPGDETTGVVRSIEAEDLPNHGADILSTDLRGLPAQSGALAFSRRGVVGLYVAAEPGSRSRILSTVAMRVVAARARVPWMLGNHETFDCSVSRTVCSRAADGSLRTGVLLRNVFTDDELTLGLGSCSEVPEGRYAVTPVTAALTCEPRLVRVMRGDPREQPLELVFRCSLGLDGRSWRSTGGELSCMPRNAGSFDCFGLTGLGHGWLNAVAEVHGSQVVLSGRFTRTNGATSDARGELALTADGSLKGELRPGDGLPPVVLRLERTD